MSEIKHRFDFGLLFTRVFIGMSYTVIHGWPKISGGPQFWEKIGGAVSIFGITAVPVMWGFLASLAEFAGGILILLGLLFRPALSLLIITMFVAASQLLAGNGGISKAAYPLEMSVILITLFITGPGKYTLKYFYSAGKSE